MSLRSVGCMDIYGIDSCFSLDLWLSLLELPLLDLIAVIISMFWRSYAIILQSRAASSDLCMTIQDNAFDVSNSIVMGLHLFLESVSVCLEELFEDVVDHIADTARLALR